MGVPESISWLLAATGALLILAGVVGGGFEVKDVKMPKLSAPARVLAVAFGIALVALVLVGELEHGATARGGLNDPPPTVTNMPAADGTALLEREGFEVGDVRRIKAWAPHDWIIEQKTARTAGSAAPRVDLVLADSDFEFDSQRSLKSANGDDIEAGVIYQLRLSRVSPGRPLVARFVPRRIDFKGGGDREEILQRLVGEPGYVDMDSARDFDPASSWEAYLRLTNELTHEMQSQTLQSKAAAGELGASLMLILAALEVRFDLAAILRMTSLDDPDPASRIRLQEGSELLSEIWLEGPGESTDGGLGQAYRIFRRPPRADGFDQVGTASYDLDSGLLKRLDMSYKVGDGDRTGLYRLEIERGR